MSSPENIWLHGAGLSATSWPASWPGIKYDLPGHGSRPVADQPSVEAFAELLLPDLPPRFSLIGHSLGGMVALELAARLPKRTDRLILIEAVPTVRGRPLQLIGAHIARSIMGLLSPQQLARLSGVGENKAVQQHLAAQLGTMSPRALRDALTAAIHYDGRDRLSRITVPTLIIVGKRNRATHEGARMMQRQIADARLEELPGGHMLHVECSEQLAATLLPFLTSR